MNIAVIGLPGSGKTVFMTFAALKYGYNDFKIYSNYNISINGEPKSERILSRQDLDKARSGYLFLDELPIWLDSRFSMSDQNTFVNTVLQKNRKREISLFWSAQSYGMADVRLRLNTNYIIYPRIYYTEDGKQGSKEFVIKQDFFNPVDMFKYLDYGRVEAIMIPAWMNEYLEYLRDKDVIKRFDFPLKPVAGCYDTSEEVKGLAKSEELKGEMVEEAHKKALEAFYSVPVVKNIHSGRGLNSFDLELTVNGELLIIDSTTIQRIRKPNGKEYNYLYFQDKDLKRYQEVELSRICKTYFMYEEPKGSGSFYLYPTRSLWNLQKTTISTKKLVKDRISIG